MSNYYFNILEILEDLDSEIKGKDLITVYLMKYKTGNSLNINKALKSIRKRNDILFRKVGVNYYYQYKLNIKRRKR